MIGKRLGHYEILEKIGAGGMGEVYRARDTKLGREVAVKLLTRETAGDAGRLERFRREARTVAALSHPNIVTLHSVEEDDLDLDGAAEHVHFLTMELVPGSTLADSLPEGGFPLERTLDIAVPLADAVATAHDRGVIHRDLKPANVMLDRSGRVRILDFGLASLRPAGAEEDVDATLQALTAAGQLVGTVSYMAPEQLEGRLADPRSDVFALGVILYELASGSPPFRGESAAGIASAVLRDEPPSLAEARPDLPAGFLRLVRRCLRKDPDRRLQTARDVRNELEEIRQEAREARAAGPETGTGPALREQRFVLTAEHVRSLSERIPRMVGDAMTYLDNGVESETLVVYVPGAGGDHRQYEAVLEQTPFRGIAVSLFGFGPAARIRPALSLEDHNRLLGSFLDDLRRRLRPRVTVLVALSAGADQVLQFLASQKPGRSGLDGLIILGPNVSAELAFVSRCYRRLSDDPAQRLGILKEMGEAAPSLEFWLTLHEYIVQTFRKFGEDVGALARYGEGIVAPFEKNPDIFYTWFRNALERVPQVRCVFAEEETTWAEAVLSRHLEDNVLGDRFSEDVIRIVNVSHVELARADILLPLVQEVAERAKAAPAPPSAKPVEPEAGAGEIRSLAVLPLDNLSGDPTQDYFTDGMTEAITAQVAKVSRLRVISRTSVMLYKGSRRPLPEIARELRVDAIVEGSVLLAGNRVRITAQLIRAATDEHLWAETFDRDLEDVLELQSEVSRAIVEKIQVALTPRERADLSPGRKIAPEAYEAYLKGRFFWNRRDPESLRKGIASFQQVIRKDPTYALAYVGIAECYNVLGFQGATPARDSFAPAAAAARKALELDSSLAEAYISLAYASLHYDFDFAGAERNFRKGVELNPNYPTGHHWYALYFTNLGLREEALARIDLAWELDPLAPIIRTAQAWISYMFRDFDASVEHYRKVLEVDDDFFAARLFLGNTYAMQGRYPEAIAEFRRAREVVRDSPLVLGGLGYALGRSGDANGAKKCLDELQAMSRKGYVRPHEFALIHTGLGETAKALDYLERAYEERGNWLNYMKVEPAWDPLRGQPRFVALLEKVLGS